MSTRFGSNRGRGNDDHGNRAMSMRNLRRRPNVSTNSNGRRRKSYAEGSESESSRSLSRRGSRGFPKSLAPFVHLRDTSKIDKELDEIEKSTHKFKAPIQADLEKQDIPNRTTTYNRENSMHAIPNRTISYNRENSMHASFLTNDSVNDFNTSGLTNESNDYLENKTNGDAPRNSRRSYDSGCHDDIVDTDGETDNDSKSVPIDPDTLYGKFQLSRRSVGKLVNNEYVQITIILLIVLNGILIGISTTEWIQGDDERKIIVEKIDLFFLIVFTIEIAMQLYYYALALFLDAWLVFDLVVVILSWCAIWITTDGDEDGGDFTVLRAFRIFRGARLVTRVAPLRDLVMALGEVLPKMYAIVGLLFVIFYVFAVLFTEQFSDVDLEYDYFTTLHDSFLSCFQMMTMEWVDICRPLMESKKQAWWSIVAFVMIAGFIVFNLIVAVVVEAVAATEDSARNEDGMELDHRAADVAEANERIDLLNSHLHEMMQQQEQIQNMLETMAAELLNLKAEEMKAQQREKNLREEVNRRIEDQKKIEEDDDEEPRASAALKISMQFLRKIEEKKATRKEEELAAAASDHESHNSSSVKRKPPGKSLSVISKDGSGKSIGSLHSGDSIRSIPNQIESPKHRHTISTASASARPSPAVRPSNFSRLRSTDSSASGEGTERRSRAVSNWKSLLVSAQKDPTI